MIKIMTIVGARPQFIKAAVVSRALSLESSVKEIIIHTGQHYDQNMSDIFFSEMEIPTPDHFLKISGGTHGEMTGEMLVGIEKILVQDKPDIVLVYGDTNSTLAGALAAAKLNIPVAHVEAGLRSFNRKMPEEINRIMTDRVSRYLFCPTDNAVELLNREGMRTSENVLVENVGDVMFDASLYYEKKQKTSPEVFQLIKKYQDNGFYLATIHRAETTDDRSRLANVFSALDEISCERKIILPLHPRTKKMLSHFSIQPKNIDLIDPVGYFDMIALLKHSLGVLTDSGGLQKEAYFFKSPCLILRDETEWVELINHGVGRIVGTDRDTIISNEADFMGKKLNVDIAIYGDGRSGEKIAKVLAT